MGFLDTLLGRTTRVQPNLDVLFAIPSAALTLQAALELAPTGVGAVCFKAAEGAAAAQSETDIRDLLTLDPTLDVAVSHDEFGYTWITCTQTVVDLAALVTGLHAINATLADAGFGPSLLCTVVGFRAAAPVDVEAPHRVGLVYLFKRGTVYPFAPTGGLRRDTPLEMQIRAALAGDLTIEPDLERWFPVWNAPVP
ncbi:hypothetical protein I4I84_25420 [Pseudonocardia sp. KRD-182]|uniref:PspA-associated protein PspAB n=1 Tax=Pseudonocardia oceani TaxID=2792013 RepID=UPI001C49D3E4|nr:hypothetical protein [Pseudonocardia oceani]MBW0112060.1 hypothetical protein [Pseudonocardia oceani]